MVFTATRPIATCKLNGMEDGNKKAQMKTQTAQHGINTEWYWSELGDVGSAMVDNVLRVLSQYCLHLIRQDWVNTRKRGAKRCFLDERR